MAAQADVHVAVLAGGPSDEHEVSLQSGAEMLGQLRGGGFTVRPVFLSRANTWHFGPIGADLAAAAQTPGLALEPALSRLRESREVACIALHGRFGEDGQLQRLFEQHGIRFTGSGSHASAIGMDKEQSKLAAATLGGHCAPHDVVSGNGASKLPLKKLLQHIGLPCVVKPVCGGSSVGVSRVRAEGELEPALRGALAADVGGRALVEAWQEGTEVTCGVLRVDETVRCLPLVAIRPAGDAFYDYNAKYVAEDTQLLCPAPVSDSARAAMERLSLGLHASLELRGFVRVDFILRRADDVPVFLELNTLPGFTSHSLVPRAAGVAGWSRLDVLRALLADTDEAA